MVIRDAVQAAVQSLQEAGIADAKTDAFLLLEAACGIDRTGFLLRQSEELSEDAFSCYREMIDRRRAHEPCQYIMGVCEFCGLSFLVNPNVLIPRQDTELLVEKALTGLPEQACVLDLCTGSGAIAVSLKHFRPDLEVTAVDISEAALETARENSRRNQCAVTFVLSDLFAELDPDQTFDRIVSNPPYITDSEYETLMPEVRDHEPALALKAGPQGLDIYRRLIAEAPAHLKPEGMLAVEIGCFQAEAVSQLFSEHGFEDLQILKDLAGLDRVVCGIRRG